MTIYGLLINLIVDALYSWGRMFIALFISILVSVGIGVYAATSRGAERIILPVTDILQTLPILAFFPIALIVFVVYLPGYIGINAAVIFLIITSMLWNIIFGVYESIKTIPREFLEVADLYRMGIMQRLRKIFIPAALPRIVQQSILSWSIGLFYLVTSEIFSVGSQNDQVVHGIGVALVQLSPATSQYGWTGYLLGIAVFIAFVIATRFLFFKPLEDYANRYLRPAVKAQRKIRPAMFVSWFSKRIITQPFANLRTQAAPKKKAKIPVYSKLARPQAKQKEGIAKWVYYIVAIAVIVSLSAYVFSTSSTLLSDAYTSVVALAFSFARIWFAFAIITVVALPVCVYLIFISKQSSKYLLLFQIAASIPATILLPGIAIAFAGFPYHAEIVAFIIFFLSGIWYVIFSVIASTRTLQPSIFEVKKLFGVKGTQAWKSIYIKAMLPGFITGALTAIAAEWNASIVAECFTTSGISTSGSIISCISSPGIGKLLDGAISGTPANLILMGVALLALVVMILLINTFVWKRMYKSVSKVYG